MNKWMDMKAIAEELEISTYTVRRMLDRDGVPVCKLPGKWQILRTDFDALMARRYN